MHEQNGDRYRALELEISQRLRPLCEGWSDEQFTSLVQRVTAIALKYDFGASEQMPELQLTQLMVAEMNEMADRSAAIRAQLYTVEGPSGIRDDGDTRPDSPSRNDVGGQRMLDGA